MFFSDIFDIILNIWHWKFKLIFPWMYVIIMLCTHFRVKLDYVVYWMLRNSWIKTGILRDSNRIRTHNHLIRKQTLNNLAKLAKRLNCVVTTYLYRALECSIQSNAPYRQALTTQLNHFANFAESFFLVCVLLSYIFPRVINRYILKSNMCIGTS